MAINPANISGAKSNLKSIPSMKGTGNAAPINPADIPGIKSNLTSLSSLKDTGSIISNATSSVTSGVKDPIGAVLAKTLSSINSLSAVVSSKISKLEEQIVKAADKTGKVKLVNNVIVVTLQPEDAAKLPMYQAKIQGEINRLNSTISMVKIAVATLKTISTTAKTLKKAMDVQEIMLSLGNPVAKVTTILIKKAIKIIFYKDVLNEYVNILSKQSDLTQKALKTMVEKFSKLSVQFVVDTGKSNGVTVSTQQAEEIIRDASLTTTITGSGNAMQDYTNDDGRQFVLAVEAYGSRELIARGRDKFSNLLVAETSPSFISTPDQLLEELKSILNQQN